jgi:uncharacterized membrane protein
MEMQRTVRIERPLEDVWAFLERTANDFAWQADLLDEVVVYESPTGVGTRVHEKRRGFVESTWEITEVIPMQRIAYKSIESPIPYEGAYLFEGDDGATRFTYWARCDLRGAQKLIALLGRRQSQKQLDINLHRLKRMLEM